MAKVAAVQGFQVRCCELAHERRADLAAGCLVNAEEEMKTLRRAPGRASAKRWNDAMRRKRLLNLKCKNGPLIPQSVLKQLAALNLPPNEFVYQACLEKLLRGA